MCQYALIKIVLPPSLIIGPFGKITRIKKIKNDNKFVCNYYCFYKFVLYERELVYVFNVVFNVN